MKLVLPIYLLLTMVCAAAPIEFRWIQPPQYRTNAWFVLFHAPTSGTFNELTFAGVSVTNCFYDGPMYPGNNFFTVVYFAPTTNGMSMSQASNETCLTNTIMTTVSNVIFLTTTNLNSGWSPMQTNSILVGGQPVEYYKSVMSISRSNSISFPTQ